MKNPIIQRAVEIVGSQKKLAVLCGVSQPTVWRWLHGGGIESKHVLKISSATGGQVAVVDILVEADKSAA